MMEASVRILLNSSTRHFPIPLGHPLKTNSFLKPSQKPFLSPSSFRHRSIPLPPLSLSTPGSRIVCSAAHFPHQGHHLSTPSGFPDSLSSSPFRLNPPFSCSTLFRIFSAPNGNSFEWMYANNGVQGRENGVLGDKGPIFTAVILGWLGSKPKHLRKYVELYNSRGIHAITFAASVQDALSFDLGKKMEERILGLTRELTSWLSESEKDGRERFLIFHTFSNTGWFGYGAILVNWLSRPDLLEKIKGCVFDSGGDPNIDPKVWAAGFTAALLKKYSSSAYPLVGAGAGERNGVETLKIREPLFIETCLLSAFEKLFSYLFNLPHVNQKLTKIISVLSENQPSCPQLYLYSTGDRVIPYQSVESLIELQRRSGRNVRSFNFGSSPHVDHYRSFPVEYSSQLETFLNECVVAVKDCKTHATLVDTS